MPCTYEEFPHEKAARAKKYQTRVKAGVKGRYKKELDKLTRMLCGTLQAIEVAYEQGRSYPELPKEVVAWAKQHKKRDAERGEPWKSPDSAAS